MLVSPHALNTVAGVVLNNTLLPPCEPPKFVPAMTTGRLAGPDVGFRDAICGGTGFGTIVVESVVPSMSSSIFTLWVVDVEIEYPTHSRRRSVVDCGTAALNVQLKTTGAVGLVARAGPTFVQSVLVLLTRSLAWGAITP